MPSFNIIAAVDEDFGIGKGGRLPWRLSGDMKYFSRITTRSAANGRQNIVIMGRKTWESLPAGFQPLPKRTNWVLTHNSRFSLPADVRRADGLEQALGLIEREDSSGEIFIIGGALIFQEALHHPLCQRLYLTHILKTFSCDTFFPSDLSGFELVSRSDVQQEGDIRYFFAEYACLK